MISKTAIELAELVTADTGLPHPDPSSSYWMLPPSPLAKVRSEDLPTTRDVVIIGSGITAASIARTLLLHDPTYTVGVLEARALCSGATGRNGGQLVAYGGTTYGKLKKTFGKGMASQIVLFTFENIRKTAELIREYGSSAEYREVTRHKSYGDEASFQEAIDSVREFERDNPSMIGMYQFLSKDEAARIHGVHNIAGLCKFRAGALSPYRLVTSIFAQLLEQHAPARLSLDTNTPVTEITHDASSDSKYPYVITTHRGTVRTSQVVHSTNGYAGHLLPKLRGPLYPFRGTMTVQELGERLPNRGGSDSWSLHCRPSYDTESGRCAAGTYYMQQNPSSGYFYFGGGEETASGTITRDDSLSPQHSVARLQEKLLALFGLQDEEDGDIISAWSGIMGYTADGQPMVGRLPSTITGRDGDGEWIAAGFNGMGMSMCVSSGEAIARMVLGETAGDTVPGAFHLTPSRLTHRLTADGSIAGLLRMFST